MDDEYIINLHKEIQVDIFNWKKVAYIGEILYKNRNNMENGDYDNWVETRLFISPKYADFYEYIYQNKQMVEQFTFKNSIPGNLSKLKEILVHANEDYKTGNLDQSQLNKISSVSGKIVEYINWIIEDRGL